MPAALPDTAVQWGGPACLQHRDRDQLTGDELMDQDYNRALDLRFTDLESTTLAESDLTFTRPSPARYDDSDGIIRLVGFGEPRLIK
jgi:hypothetical protein